MTRSGYVLKLTEADHTCATCSAPIRLPKIGEKWWNISTGHLYEIRSTPSEHEPWWGSHRVGAPETGYGCDPGVQAAVWLRAVREGQWCFAPARAGVTPDLDQARDGYEPVSPLDLAMGWTAAKSVKGNNDGRRQDKGDGSERVSGIHGNDGSDLRKQSGSQEQESADDVGTTVSGHSEPSRLLAGSGEGDAKDERGAPAHAGVAPDPDQARNLAREELARRRLSPDVEAMAGEDFVARSRAAAAHSAPLTQAAAEAFASGPEVSGGTDVEPSEATETDSSRAEVPSFEEVWKVKIAEGYRYGRDALDQVRFGWNLRNEAALGVPSQMRFDASLGQDMTRNPTTEEELARVRSELNHYRDKYLNDDRIPIANAEIIRLKSEVAAITEASTLLLVERDELIDQWAQRLAEEVCREPDPIDSPEAVRISDAEILRLQREIAAMRDSINFCSGSCRLPEDTAPMIDGVRFPVDDAEIIRLQREADANPIGSVSSSEVTASAPVVTRALPRIWIVQNGSTWTVKMGVLVIASFADEREALAVQTLLMEALEALWPALWPDPDEAKASYNQGFQHAAAVVDSFVSDELNVILAKAEERQRDTKAEYKRVYARYMGRRSDPRAHHYSGDLENGRLLEAEHMCDFIRARSAIVTVRKPVPHFLPSDFLPGGSRDTKKGEK